MQSDIDSRTTGPTPDECVLLSDGEGTVVWGDPTAADALGRPATAVTGRSVTSLLGPSAPNPPQRGTAPITDTLTIPADDGGVREITVTVDTIAAPGATSVYRCHRTADEQLGAHDVLARVDDAVVAFDAEWRYTYANETAERLLGRSSADLHGAVIWDLFPQTVGTDIEHELRHAMATQEPSTLETHSDSLDRWLEVRVFPSPTGASVYFRDVSARKAREDQLQRERDLVEQLLGVSPMGIAVHTPDGRFVRVNDRAEEIIGIDREDLLDTVLDEPIWDARGPDGDPFPDEAFPLNVVLRTGEPTFGTEMSVRRRDGTRFWLSVGAAPVLNDAGDVEFVIVSFEEITDRKERETALRRERDLTEQLLRVSPLGIAVHTPDGRFVRVNERAEEILGVDHGELVGTELDESGWDAYGPDGDPFPDEAFPFNVVLRTGEPTFGTEMTIRRRDGTHIWLSVSAAPLLDGDGDIERIVVGFEEITERKADESRLAAQRDALGRLNDLNELVRDVHRTITGATDRETIERAVCDAFAESTSYPVAMTTRRRADEMRVAHAAGVPAAAQSTLRSDGGTRLESAIARAGTDATVTVLSDVGTDDSQPALSAFAADHGIATLGNVPIEYDGVAYGVLTVGATHPDAFDERERAVFAELGQLLGTAIEASQTKQLLYATAVLELDLAVSADVEPLAALNARLGGQWTLDGVVPVDAGRYLLYVDVGPTAIDEIERAADGVAGLDSFRSIDTGSTQLLELRVDHDTPISALLDAGGRIRDGTIEHGEARFVVDVTPDTDVRGYLGRIEQRGISVDLLAKREVERTAPVWGDAATDTELTTRQRTVLEAAYFSGYFDWPRRRTTGEELADSLDIASSTLHQHLRVASGKVLGQYLDGAAATGDP